MGESGGKAAEISLKDQGNEFFKAGNYLKAAALYTQAIKQDPSNPTLYSNRAAAFLHLVKLNKALADAETTISLKPDWEKALAAFEVALKYNSQSSEVSKKIKRLTQLARDKKRAQEVETMRSNVDMSKHLDSVKSELSVKHGAEDNWKEIFSFLVETMQIAVKSWHEKSTVDPRVYFLLHKDKTDTEKYAPVVNIDKAFESPHTHGNCFSFLRQYAEDSFSRAACLVAPKSLISYPQVWKGQGSRKWKHGQNDGFFFQFESPSLRKIWFIPSSTEKGQTLCRDPVALDIGMHEILPRVFKQG
ncbi:UNVERIFIED_CONTAM: Stress-induced-phosphoprotein 1 [Sesamum calycinum]|uniref:Stress-induced-phosphoprotein 1 n=1 Tax=Sesamum calycinum TaxID=2727403 RepID=A0AAW2ISJ7_9LAMI